MTVQRYHSWDSEDDEDGHYVAHDDYAALLKERDAMAAENARLKQSIDEISEAFETGTDGALATAVNEAVNLTTPATDGVLKRIQAQGVDNLATFAGKEYQRFVGDKTLQRKWKGIVLLCTDFAAQLRKEASNG
ncbi:hypothetical protein EDF88_3909 [Buttiauxella sp. BIGb0552]|uniref:hypothetical protein n=1 Tax=Buttiauxella sp. BIGb0552 TaxID=2485120 RepID=UPI0010647D5C|nr:hypothetical protein [Buttiauxella sp. BIGb0552]TDX14592.1 hypothetical protein EDF88_3909 [Buttiauxella sp. BIGb0552]